MTFMKGRSEPNGAFHIYELFIIESIVLISIIFKIRSTGDPKDTRKGMKNESFTAIQTHADKNKLKHA